MITCALLDMLTALLESLVGLLPDWELDLTETMGASGANIPAFGDIVTTGHSPLQMVLMYAKKYNNFLPLDQIFIMVGIFVTFVAAIVAYRGIRYIIAVVRGSGS